MELRNLRKTLLFIRNLFCKQHKKIVNISEKKSKSAVQRRSVFFASHSVNLSLFTEFLKTFWVKSSIAFFTKI